MRLRERAVGCTRGKKIALDTPPTSWRADFHFTAATFELGLGSEIETKWGRVEYIQVPVSPCSVEYGVQGGHA